MSYRYIEDRGSTRESRCEFERTLRGEYCPEDGEVTLDGLTLCDRHADHLRLEERLTYWRAILAHLELWSGEARRRSRADVARLLEIERGYWRSSSVPHKLKMDATEKMVLAKVGLHRYGSRYSSWAVP